MSNLYRDCPKCQTPVHRNTKACKGCGGPSPWAAADVPAPEVVAVPEAAPGAPLTFLDHTVATGTLPNPSPEQLVNLSPTDAEVAEFLHNQPAMVAARVEEAERAAAEAAANGPHVFLEKYSTMIGVSMAHFRPNQVVTDFALVQFLRSLMARGEAVPMVPVGGAAGMACCPNCRTTFRVPSPLPAKRAG